MEMRDKVMTIGGLALLAAIVLQAGCQSSGEQAAPQPPDVRQEWVSAAVTATVEKIDYETREVTLRGPRGRTVDIVADRRIERLNEIEAGDQVRATYYVSLASEIRKPTEEEERAPLTVLEGAGKAPPGTSPAAGGLRRIRAVVTVEGINRADETVTLKGPRGRYLTVRAADPARLDKVNVGDTVIITYTEALAVSLRKVR
ncbi:MAG: hypothetical protein ACYTAN_05435 [Planctomycetota bacterium]|jgi:hypothetical protein